MDDPTLTESATGLEDLVDPSTEQVRETDLATWCRANKPSFARLVEIIAQVADALQRAHDSQVIHGDVRPSRIFLGAADVPLLVDVGYAQRAERPALADASAGSMVYLSPEQLRGEAHRVDERSDIYGLGVVFYQLLVGRLPFEGPSRDELLDRIAEGDPPSLRSIDSRIPEELERICLKCFVKLKNERYRSGAELAHELRRWSATARDCVISYSSKDEAVGRTLLGLLESHGVRCWIACCDVAPGADYREEIMSAIGASPALVVLLSNASCKSVFVQHEVERADAKQKRIFPVRLEDVDLGEAFEFHLSNRQWLDSWSLSWEQIAQRLAGPIQHLKTPHCYDSPSGSTTAVAPQKQPARKAPTADVVQESRPQRVPEASAALGSEIVPKGLRSYDAEDAGFFLDLLPGPRDVDGLPDSLRHWRNRIRGRSIEPSFSLGILFGPSGCGKSSLVKAGLLPILKHDGVLTVYVEATRDETEARLRAGLHQACDWLPPDADILRSIELLRRQPSAAPMNSDAPINKVFIVLDQFEQWLHARQGKADSELARALRQCDGHHAQCLILVRDDFWLAASRFMEEELEIELDSNNCRRVDLFDPRHARNVLARFGRVYGCLPRAPEPLTPDQERFLNDVIAELVQDGRIVPVRLSLFAEMIKDKEWFPATLKTLGPHGIGLAFLQETFASPRYKPQQQIASAVLATLLPERGTDIKGHMRCKADLMEASGCHDKPREFERALATLDTDLRLITPTEPQGVSQTGAAPGLIENDNRYYQLTHDYLVTPVRTWLTIQQRETFRGRLRIRFEQRTAEWNASSDKRHLPGWWEWVLFRGLSSKSAWNPSQRRMMQSAGRHYTVRSVLIGLACACLAGFAYVRHSEQQARELLHALRVAETKEVPPILDEMRLMEYWLRPKLDELAGQATDPKTELHVRLALSRMGEPEQPRIVERLLTASPDEARVIGIALRDDARMLDEIRKHLSEENAAHQLRAAAALASAGFKAPPQWQHAAVAIARRLVQESPILLNGWSESLESWKSGMLEPLHAILSDSKSGVAERTMAASVIARYAEHASDLAASLRTAGAPQFAVLWERVERLPDRTQLQESMERELERPLAGETEDDKEQMAQRQANAAMVLAHLRSADAVLRHLRHRQDPRLRSYLIARFHAFGVPPSFLIKHVLGDEHDPSVRAGLILALGEYPFDELPADRREQLVEACMQIYRDDPSAGLHSAARWTLGRWKLSGLLAEIDGKVVTREPRTGFDWYQTNSGFTMVVLQGPATFQMGSRPDDPEFGDDEHVHTRRIPRSFAIATAEATIEQFERFRKLPERKKRYTPEDTCPAIGVSWFDAAAYCNWLTVQELGREAATVEMCYEEGPEFKLKKNYLSLRGYRLPTEAEWEFACRADTTTRRPYGHSDRLLEHYAWHIFNSQDRVWPVGLLKPNHFGLFDMLGNGYEWCQERESPYPIETSQVVDDREDSRLDVDPNGPRPTRGGAFYDQPSMLRSANRYFYPANTAYKDAVGFRVARTLSVTE